MRAGCARTGEFNLDRVGSGDEGSSSDTAVPRTDGKSGRYEIGQRDQLQFSYCRPLPAAGALTLDRYCPLAVWYNTLRHKWNGRLTFGRLPARESYPASSVLFPRLLG